MFSRFFIIILLLGMASAMLPTSPADEARDEVLAYLDKIIIPQLNFREATFREAIDFLKLRSRELAPAELPDWKVSTTIQNPEKVEPVGLTYTAKNVSVLDALVELAGKAHYEVYASNYRIVFVPRGERPIGNNPTDAATFRQVRAEANSASGR